VPGTFNAVQKTSSFGGIGTNLQPDPAPDLRVEVKYRF